MPPRVNRACHALPHALALPRHRWPRRSDRHDNLKLIHHSRQKRRAPTQEFTTLRGTRIRHVANDVVKHGVLVIAPAQAGGANARLLMEW